MSLVKREIRNTQQMRYATCQCVHWTERLLVCSWKCPVICLQTSVRKYVFYVFFNLKRHDFLLFYPRGASNARVLAIIVCLCVTRRYCIKTVKHRITQTTLRDSPGTLVFWRQQSLVDDSPSPEICAQSDPPPFEHQNFDQYPLIAPRSWQLAKKFN